MFTEIFPIFLVRASFDGTVLSGKINYFRIFFLRFALIRLILWNVSDSVWFSGPQFWEVPLVSHFRLPPHSNRKYHSASRLWLAFMLPHRCYFGLSMYTIHSLLLVWARVYFILSTEGVWQLWDRNPIGATFAVAHWMPSINTWIQRPSRLNNLSCF